MCCGRASSRRLSCSARQVWVRQDSWSSTSCCARFRLCWSPEPDSLPTVSLQQSPCLPACSSCHTGSCAEKRASRGVWSTGSLHPSAARQPVPPRSAGPATLCTHGTHCGQVRVRGCNLTGKGCTVCAAAQPWQLRARRRPPSTQDSSSGFHAAGWWLNARSEPSQQRTLRQNGQSLLELVPREVSRTLLRLLLTLHGFGNAHVIELGESLHHSLQLCVHGIPVADQLVSRFLRSGTLLLLLLHVLSSATSCTVSCFRTVSATLETDFSSVALIIWTSRARDQHCRRQLVLFLLQSHVLCARPFFITRRSRTGVTIDLVNTTHWNARLPPGQSCSFSQAWQISLSLAVDFNSKPLSHSQV